MSLSWHQRPLVTAWVLTVHGQPEGVGATPERALVDARQRRREEYAALPQPDCPLQKWLEPLETAELILLSSSSLQQLANALLGWVDPGIRERASWVASLQRTRKFLSKSSRHRLQL